MTLKCLIIDDEPIARKIVEQYCSYLPELEIVASCKDALEAKQLLQTSEVDIIFVDINMPILDGLAFVKTLRKLPQVIFTTAYKEYALEAFDINACDYLLKPFSIERFIVAVDKAKEKILPAAPKPQPGSQPSEESSIYLKVEGKIFRIDLEQLHYAEASGNNVKIVMQDGQIAPTMTFSALEELLPKNKFIRVHRSFIINKEKIRIIVGNRVYIGQKVIPIGSNYKDSFFREIGIK